MYVDFVTFLATCLRHFLVDTADSGLLKSYLILQCTERQGHIWLGNTYLSSWSYDWRWTLWLISSWSFYLILPWKPEDKFTQLLTVNLEPSDYKFQRHFSKGTIAADGDFSHEIRPLWIKIVGLNSFNQGGMNCPPQKLLNAGSLGWARALLLHSCWKFLSFKSVQI